jgi:hypothetical protein
MLNRGDILVNFGSYEVVSFDCYGTLIDWEDGIVSGLRPVLSHHGVEATDNEILNLHAQTEHRLQSTSTRGNYTKYRDVLREEVREAGRRWGFEPEPSERVEVLAAIPRHRRGIESDEEQVQVGYHLQRGRWVVRPDGVPLGGGVRLDSYSRAGRDLQTFAEHLQVGHGADRGGTAEALARRRESLPRPRPREEAGFVHRVGAQTGE